MPGHCQIDVLALNLGAYFKVSTVAPAIFSVGFLQTGRKLGGFVGQQRGDRSRWDLVNRHAAGHGMAEQGYGTGMATFPRRNTEGQGAKITSNRQGITGNPRGCVVLNGENGADLKQQTTAANEIANISALERRVVLMQGIADKIRHYRKTFRPPVFYALDSYVLWLSVALACLIMAILFVNLYLLVASDIQLLRPWDQAWLFLCEIPLIFGMLQVYFQGAERRFRRLNPAIKRVNFRTPYASLDSEKHAYLRNIFKSEDDLQQLAKRLIDEWEWRREVKRRAQDPMWTHAIAFYRLPTGSNFAAYMTGLVAVVAGIVIATITPEAVFASMADYLEDAWSLIRLMLWVVVIPFAACVLPGALIISFVKDLLELFIERLNDQYLSQKAFYRFISQILELHDREEPLLLRKTRAQVYWTIRLCITPLRNVPAVWMRIRRTRVLMRRMKRSGAVI